MAKKLYPRRADGVPWKAIGDDEGMLLKLKTGDYYMVNASALRIWELAAGPSPVSEIAAELTRNFKVSEAEALRASRAFYHRLEKTELATLHDGPTKPCAGSGPLPRRLSRSADRRAWRKPTLEHYGNLRMITPLN